MKKKSEIILMGLSLLFLSIIKVTMLIDIHTIQKGKKMKFSCNSSSERESLLKVWYMGLQMLFMWC